jgi:hypothetical protein
MALSLEVRDKPFLILVHIAYQTIILVVDIRVTVTRGTLLLPVALVREMPKDYGIEFIRPYYRRTVLTVLL